MNFIENWTIDLNKLPTYDNFKKPFSITFDKELSKLLISGINPKITSSMITNYKSNVYSNIDNDNNLIVYHNNRHGLGRFYSDNDSSPCCHSKYIKHTIFSYQNWLDIDMIKGHSSILLHIGNKNGETLPAFNTVVRNFDTKWREIAKYYKKKCNVDLDEDNVKYFFNMSIYGGGYSTWLKKLADVEDSNRFGYPIKVIPETIDIHPFMELFKKECVKLSDLIFKNNPEISAIVCSDDMGDYKKKSTTISYFCGILENHIVYMVYNYLVKNGGILPNECLPELDGICLPRLDGIDYESLIEGINSLLNPIDIKFKIKPYGKFVLNDIIEMRRGLIVDNIKGGMSEKEVIPSLDNIFTYKTLIETANESEFMELYFKINGKKVVLQGDNIYIYYLNEWRIEPEKNCKILKHSLNDLFADYIKTALKIISNELIKYVDDKGVVDKIKKKQASILGLNSSIKKMTFIANVSSMLKNKLATQFDKREFDIGIQDLYNINFKNGVYDVKNKLFRQRTESDYITKILDYDYTPIDKISSDIHDNVRLFFERIQPDPEQRLFTLSYLAYCITGSTSKQKFKMNIGYTASNGKSTEVAVHEKVFPIYTKKLDKKTFDKDFQKRHKFIISCLNEPIRLAYLEELSNDKKLDAEFLKDWIDGKKLTCEIMFGTSMEHSIQAKIMTCSNHSFKVDTDEGVMRRGLLQFYNSKFVSDESLVDESKHIYKGIEAFEKMFDDDDYKNAYFHLLLKHVDELHIPKKNVDDFRDAAEQGDSLQTAIEDNYVITNNVNDFVSKHELTADLYPNSWDKISDKLKSLGLRYDKNKMINSNRGCFSGITPLHPLHPNL